MLFFYGTLRHPELLATVLGRAPGALPRAWLPGHEVRWIEGAMAPMIVEGGAGAEGVLFAPEPADLIRLDTYESGFSFGPRTMEVETEEGPVAAGVYFPDPDRFTPGAPFDLEDWAARWAHVAVPAAREFLARHEKGEAAHRLNRFFHGMEARAWARHLAGRGAPTTRRKAGNPVEVTTLRRGYDGFFRFLDFDLRHRRFDGSWTPIFSREVFVGFDGALVLPYDPRTDEVLLIEQLRLSNVVRGDPHPMCLEPVAGMIEAGETAEDTAVREAAEEAGLTIERLIPITASYPSPGYSTEFHHSFLGIADLSGAGQRLGGADGEMEDIRTHVLSHDAALELVDSGEINVTPLAMMLLWLDREKRRGGGKLEFTPPAS